MRFMSDDQTDREALLTEPEAARLLSISPYTLRLYRTQKRVPHFKFDRRVAYDPADIEKFKARHYCPVPELAKAA